MNAQLIKEGHSREERVVYLREMASQQLDALRENPTIRALDGAVLPPAAEE